MAASLKLNLAITLGALSAALLAFYLIMIFVPMDKIFDTKVKDNVNQSLWEVSRQLMQFWELLHVFVIAAVFALAIALIYVCYRSK
tara:strand:+ start:13556 stop:13813 length:258 start_codon:yes stop_codon:yes gene_type:complete